MKHLNLKELLGKRKEMDAKKQTEEGSSGLKGLGAKSWSPDRKWSEVELTAQHLK